MGRSFKGPRRVGARLAAAACLSAALLSAAEAQAQRRGDEIYIACPGPTIEIGLDADVAGDWRGPVGRGRLADTRVVEGRRGQGLECGYRAFGDVVYFRRRAPQEAAACEAIRDGFVCASPRRGGPVEGQFTLRGDQTIDLDAGLRGAGSPDLLLQRRGALRRALNPLGETAIARGVVAEPRRADCLAANYSTRRIDVTAFRRGEWFCVRTSANRYARLQLVERRVSIGGPARLRFNYTVWRKRGR